MASASAWMLALAAARQATGLEEAAAGLPRLVFQPEVFALENCSCVRRHGGAALSRFYHLDYRNAARSGLNHQISNLRAILAEGLGLVLHHRLHGARGEHRVDRQVDVARHGYGH